MVGGPLLLQYLDNICTLEYCGQYSLYFVNSFVNGTTQDCFDWLLILWTSDRLIQTVNLLLVIPYKINKYRCHKLTCFMMHI